MKYPNKAVAALALGAIVIAVPASAQARGSAASGERVEAQATGTPQRNERTPPGLAKLLADPNKGIARALIATEGSNSRLQDRPDSP